MVPTAKGGTSPSETPLWQIAARRGRWQSVNRLPSWDREHQAKFVSGTRFPSASPSSSPLSHSCLVADKSISFWKITEVQRGSYFYALFRKLSFPCGDSASWYSSAALCRSSPGCPPTPTLSELVHTSWQSAHPRHPNPASLAACGTAEGLNP